MPLINFAGLASGIDSTALIDAVLEQQRAARIAPLETKLTELEDRNTALDELKTLLTDLKSSAEGFRLVNGGALSKTVLSSDETVLTASASNAASPGTYSFTVNQLAENATFSFDDRFSDGSSTINSSINDGASAADRTVSFTIGSGGEAESVAIEVTSSMTAAEFVTEFNDQSDAATASLVNVGTSENLSYAIILQSSKTGTEEGSITLDSVGSEITGAGSGAFSSNQLDQAVNLELTLDGVSGTIERSSNTVSDLVPGLTITAQDTGSANITVGVDAESTQSSIQDFVDAYNEIITFISENDLVIQEQEGSEVTNIFGPLNGTSLDENVLTSLRQAFSDAGITGGTVNILADLGITTARDGSLEFDSDTFSEATANDPDSVSTILENLGEDLAAVNGTIATYTRFNGLIDQSTKSNSEQITNTQNRIGEVEESLAKQEQALVARFARLESQVGQLQSQQNALTSLLPAG